MDVKGAVGLAKQHIAHLFEEEELSNVGLEEVEWDEEHQEWIVTIGFSRPWDQPKNSLATLASSIYPRRTFKIVRISAQDQRVISVKNKAIAE